MKPPSKGAATLAIWSQTGKGAMKILETVSTVSTVSTGRTVKVTCSAYPPPRQLAPNSCLNYIPDGTQTYTALVRDGQGRPQRGVSVSWHTSDGADSHFRVNQTPCKTNASGVCSAEIKDMAPKPGEKITITAVTSGASGIGHLTFQ